MVVEDTPPPTPPPSNTPQICSHLTKDRASSVISASLYTIIGIGRAYTHVELPHVAQQPPPQLHYASPSPQLGQGLLGPATAHYESQAISLSSAFSTMTLQDLTWHMDTDNNCTIEFDAFGFSVKDFLTRHILLRCDSSDDLYPVTKLSTPPTAFLSTSASTWHQRLGHPSDKVIRSLVSRRFI
nr:ribonuclease H-like domain-containing protein [Tanacetum cinerariifolium]